jgi:hypothetical protein
LFFRDDASFAGSNPANSIMQNRWLGRLLITLALLVVVAGALWHFLNLGVRPPAVTSPPIAKSDFKYHYTPPALPSAPTKAETESDTSERPIPPQISREKAEEWLTRHNRNAASLLAAFRALGDTNYLNEAATNFPNDPHVELAILAHDAFPADRRKWLELFKTSSLSNSLADYFSAQDHFKNGNTDAAVNDLLAASGKSQFDNFEMESRLDSEAMYSYAGKSQIESGLASLADISAEALPELAIFKRLAQGMGDLQKQYLDAGDAESSVNLAQMGMALGAQISNGDSGKYIINQLVGRAIEAIALSHLDQNTSYDFLDGQTPAQVLQQLKDQRTSARELARQFSAVYPSLTEEEMADYFQRSKIYGEAEAKRWVIQQHPPANP